MSVSPLRLVLGALGLTQIRHVSAVRRGRAPTPVVQVYRQMEADFGVLAPPVALHAPSPDVLAATWLLLRETLIVSGVTPRAAKEAVATAVSLSNACPYCATIHNNALSVLGASGGGTAGAQVDLESLADWALAGQRPGAPAEPPFPSEDTAHLVGVAVLMHYLNRMVNVFLRDVPLPPGVPELALSPVLWVLGKVMGRAARGPHPAGASLDLLPPAEPTADLKWAAGDAVVADAFARVFAAIDAVGQRSVSAEIRALVTENVATWQGGLRGISRRWVDELVTVLPEQQRAAGRLALLVAFASYQVDDEVIKRCREQGADDRTLIELCAWASLSAARRIGSLLSIPGPHAKVHRIRAESNGSGTPGPHSLT
jgi:AhpD family alkylhydroperoxidase